MRKLLSGVFALLILCTLVPFAHAYDEIRYLETYAIEPEYSRGSEFINGVAEVFVEDQDGIEKKAVIDVHGNYIIEPTDDDFVIRSNGLIQQGK